MSQNQITPIQQYNPYVWSIGLNANTNAGSSAYVIPYNTRISDPLSMANITTGTVTVPMAGKYFIVAGVSAGDNSGTGYVAQIMKNGAVALQGNAYIAGTSNSGGYNIVTVSGWLQLAAGDALTIRWVGGNTGNYTIIGDVTATYFQGFMISQA